MTVSDTNADTIRHALDVAHPVTGQDHDDVDAAPAALDALVAEIERERARADRAEGERDEAADIITSDLSTYGPIERLAKRADRAEAAHRRVVANESNHYDRYWMPPPEPLTDEYLDETEAKMREALTDVFCDDAAAIMLTLIAEIRMMREALQEAWGFAHNEEAFQEALAATRESEL